MDVHQSMTLCSVIRTSMNALFLTDGDHQPTLGKRDLSTVSIHLQTFTLAVHISKNTWLDPIAA